jgi:hypothetical protein
VGESDPTGRTAPARAAFLARFEAEVDPDLQLSEEERTRRALIARRLYFARLTFARVTAASKKNATGTAKIQVALGDSEEHSHAQPAAV